MMLTYKTIDNSMVTDYEINKSRFITHVKRTATEEEAIEFIESLKKKYWDATHNCSAYIIGSQGEKQKADDNGEPSGTAGKPILDVLQKQKLSDITVVVTRYFGGTKLGSGGLIRAYGHSVSVALNNAVIVERTPFKKIHLTFSYPLIGSIENYLHKNNIRILDKDFSNNICFTILVCAQNYDTIHNQITELSSANCLFSNSEDIYFDVPIHK